MKKGLRTADVHAIEALAPLITKPVPLIPDECPIHPLFARNQWESGGPRYAHLAAYSLDNGRTGYWEVVLT